MDRDTPGIADRTLDVIRSRPPGLPVFGLLTLYPATPYMSDSLRKSV
jgi:hypothetical protein